MSKTDRIKFSAQCRLVHRRAVKVSNSKERIIGWNAVKRVPAAVSWDSWMCRWFDTPRPFVDINAQNAGKQIEIEALRIHMHIILTAFVPGRNVQVTVESEMEVAAVVIELAILHSIKDLLSIRIDSEVDRIGGESGHAVDIWRSSRCNVGNE